MARRVERICCAEDWGALHVAFDGDAAAGALSEAALVMLHLSTWAGMKPSAVIVAELRRLQGPVRVALVQLDGWRGRVRGSHTRARRALRGLVALARARRVTEALAQQLGLTQARTTGRPRGSAAYDRALSVAVRMVLDAGERRMHVRRGQRRWPARKWSTAKIQTEANAAGVSVQAVYRARAQAREWARIIAEKDYVRIETAGANFPNC